MEAAINGEHYIPYQHQNKAACVCAVSLSLRPLNQIFKCLVFLCSPAEQQENGPFCKCTNSEDVIVLLCASIDNW